MADGDVKTFSIIRKGYDPEEVDENSENPEEEENGTPEGEDDFPFGF